MSQQKEGREQALERIKPLLTEGELFAWNYWQTSQQPALGADLNAKLFSLFLNGKRCDEIRRLNPAISLGQIVAARIEGDWDKRREDHLDNLLNATSQRVQQATLQTADLVCDMLAVADREHGDKLRRYLQTGDEKELGGLRVDSIFNLTKTIEALQKLTGQDRKSTVEHRGQVLYSTDTEPKSQPTPEQANAVLKLLVGMKK